MTIDEITAKLDRGEEIRFSTKWYTAWMLSIQAIKKPMTLDVEILDGIVTVKKQVEPTATEAKADA